MLSLDVASAAGMGVAMEACRLHWHGTPNVVGLLGHHVLAAILAAVWSPYAVIPAVASVSLSMALLNSKRRGELAGSVASGLSSLPWHGCAWAAVGWPGGLAVAWPSPWVLAVLPTAWLCGLVWVSPLRPAHWTPSRWAYLYPRALRRSR